MRLMCLFLLSVFLLSACTSRTLSLQERAFVGELMGDQVDPAPVRLVDGALIGMVTMTRKARPRLACRERILPPPKSDTVTVGPAAVALFNRVHVRRDLYSTDYFGPQPRHWTLINAMLFAHEMTHVWQWQNRAKTGYHPLRAAAEHGASADPYLFDIDTAPRLLDYPYEQQASIVEEYVCCRALDPEGGRTARLHAMLSEVFPVSDLARPLTSTPLSPVWDKAETKGICN